MNIPKYQLSPLLLVINNSHITESEKALVRLLIADKVDEATQLLKDLAKERSKPVAA